MVDPQDHLAVAKVGYSLGYIVRPLVVPEFRMVQLLRDYYGVDERWRFDDTHRPKRLVQVPPDKNLAVQRIDEAETRDEVVEGALSLCHHYFRRVVFFILREPWVQGWTGAGEGMDRSLAQSLRIPLDQPSVFRSVGRDRIVFVGRLGPEEENQRFARAVGKRPSTNMALLPIAVRGRVVNLVYGDNGASGNVKVSLGELMISLQKVPRAYLRIIRRRIFEAKQAAAARPGSPLPEEHEADE